MDILLLVLSLVIITAGAELLVRGSSSLALRAGLSPLFVGLTLVGFGTSSPELGASLTATARGLDDVSVGNVVGSNLFNIGVILGLTALLHPIRIAFAAVRRDLYLALFAAGLPALALLGGGTLGRTTGAGFLLLLAAYLILAYRTARRSAAGPSRSDVEAVVPFSSHGRRVALDLVAAAAGLALLVLGSRLFVTGAVELAGRWGWPELVIGLTLVSMGTSLPELATSVVAARRGQPDLAVGNVIGSNLFNVLGILGTCAVVSPQRVSPDVLRIDLPVLVGLTLLLVPLLRSGAVLDRREGVLLLLVYALYLGGLLFVRS